MRLDQAKEECARWFAVLEKREQQSRDLQKLAADRRAGRCDAREGERRRAQIQGNGVSVYDGANLETAVRTLLKHVK